jgi:hypothetical protein
LISEPEKPKLMTEPTQLERATALLRHSGAVVTAQSEGFNVTRELNGQVLEFGFLCSVRRSENEIVIWDPSGSLEWLSDESIFIASSRLPKKLDGIPKLFEGLLKQAVQIDSESNVLLNGEGVACEAMIRRIAELFGIKSRRMRIIGGEEKKALRFIDSIFRTEDTGRSAGGSAGSGVDCDFYIFDFEARGVDALLMTMAHRATILSMRKNGNLHAAAKQRLQNGDVTQILLDKKLTAKLLLDEMLDSGARGWYLINANDDLQDFETPQADTETVSRIADGFLKLSEFDCDPFVAHWTRRRVGPWPEQTESQYLDDLLFGVSRARHGKVDALRRIVAIGRLLASNDLTRGQPVVCFSDIPLNELEKHRVFRNHLGRWDFELCGVAIKRDWLSSRGGRPVKYGTEEDWESISEIERSFFQLAKSANGKIDWKAEREWRIVGDLDLRTAPMNAIVAFVPDQNDAIALQPYCRWPIVVMDQ